MICLIYLITAIHPLGQNFWKQSLVSLVPGDFATQGAKWIDTTLNLDKAVQLETLPVNVAFMIFGTLGTLGNIVNR